MSPETPGMANPASVFCIDNGGELVCDPDTGVCTCVFADGSSCEEWAFFNGECIPGEDYPADSEKLEWWQTLFLVGMGAASGAILVGSDGSRAAGAGLGAALTGGLLVTFGPGGLLRGG